MELFSISFLIEAVGGPWAALVEIVLAIVLPIAMGSWILGPISRRAGRLQGTVRFQLSDFFWLVAQFQLVLGYCLRFVGIGRRHDARRPRSRPRTRSPSRASHAPDVFRCRKPFDGGAEFTLRIARPVDSQFENTAFWIISDDVYLTPRGRYVSS